MSAAGRPSAYARASYGARVVGFALGALSLSAALPPGSSWAWVLLALHGLAWPHLAWRLARRSSRPGRAECRNLLFDHFSGGFWIPAIGFNAMPSLVMVAMMCMNSMVGGGPRQLVRGLGAHAAGVGVGLLACGLNWAPPSSMLQVVACLPLLVVHPLMVGWMTHRMLAALRSQRSTLENLSLRDALSGLYNRRCLDQRLHDEMARHRRSSSISTLVLVDLDHFKQVNDERGHETGDEAIRRFATILQEGLREGDVACRYGGEEFGVLMPDTTPVEAAAAMRRLQRQLVDRPLVDGMNVTVSCGVAGLGEGLDSPGAWLRLADQMLYRAKHQGRNRVIVAGEEVPAAQTPEAPLASARVLPRVLSGLDCGQTPLALFDPSDRLAWRNESFARLYPGPQVWSSFGELMRHCHAQRIGPRIQTDDIDAWLRGADAKRRSRAHRSFVVDMVDGRLFRVDETSFEDGWLLDVFTEVTGHGPVDDAAQASQGAAASVAIS